MEIINNSTGTSVDDPVFSVLEAELEKNDEDDEVKEEDEDINCKIDQNNSMPEGKDEYF